MRVGVLAERSAGERRVALVPDGAKRLIRAGLEVVVESGAGEEAGYPDAAYVDAGAETAHQTEVLDKSDVLLCVSRPLPEALGGLRAGQALVGLLGRQTDGAPLLELAGRGVIPISVESMPRTLSRTQAYDVLTSQATVAGYWAVLVAATTYRRYFPMLITAAGTSRPARVLVLGAGVAGLSAIGTARRLGAVVTAYDVRSSAKGEVESLGAKFLVLSSVGDASGEGGYARALTEEEQLAQRHEFETHFASFDIIITTAAVPGKRPPLLVTEAGVMKMSHGSVIIDLGAGPLGGNVEGSVAGQTVVTSRGVTIVGITNAASGVPGAASDALSSNYVALLATLIRDGELTIDPDDEVHTAIVVHREVPNAGVPAV